MPNFANLIFRTCISESSSLRSRFLGNSCVSSKFIHADSSINSFSERTHTCGQLTKNDVGKRVTLYGWIQHTRFGNKFIEIRDSYGITQCIVDQKQLTTSFRKLNLHNESVVKVVGQVRDRPRSELNDKISTGDVEVLTDQVEILAQAKNNPPLLARDDPKSLSTSLVNRLRYRYLDIRRKSMQDALRLRSKICHLLRTKLIELNFVDCETPTLFNRTPGGANEFIVPTQEQGKFYSLAQSPQQLKQLLMIGGLDRYFQICRCYRDESGRSDRQPEFTQVDIELSFTNQNLVISLIEELIHHLLTRLHDDPALETCLTSSFSDQGTLKRISFSESFSKYGTDKPDTRFDWLIEPYENQGLCIKIPFLIDQDRLQEMQSLAPNSNLTSFVYTNGTTIIFTSDNSDDARKLLGEMRVFLAAELTDKGEEIYKTKFEFLWITDFPLFTTNKQGKLEPNHHPFTAPSLDSIHLLRDNPSAVKGQHYDLVLNGQEVAGGSIRINDHKLQSYIFKDILGVNDDSFGYFVEAMKYGCPPHGGIAIGLDRLVAILMNRQSIKDVIAFPKTSAGHDLMTKCPQEIGTDVKNLYHLS